MHTIDTDILSSSGIFFNAQPRGENEGDEQRYVYTYRVLSVLPRYCTVREFPLGGVPNSTDRTYRLVVVQRAMSFP